jgi:hypothetical protein
MLAIKQYGNIIQDGVILYQKSGHENLDDN